MARTKASVGAKLSCGKSSKARSLAAPPPSSSPSASSSKVSSSGNPYCPRPTPNWQSPITRFFIGGPGEKEASDNDTESGGSSATKRRKRAQVITSDTESDNETEAKIAENKSTEEAADIANGTHNGDLDSSVLSVTEERPPSPDPSSHKIIEYFELTKAKKAAPAPESKTPPKSKGKGKGKKTVEKATKSDDKQTPNGQQKSDAKSRVDDEAMSVEKENLKPESNADKRRDDKVARAEKRDLTEAEENAAKRAKVA